MVALRRQHRAASTAAAKSPAKPQQPKPKAKKASSPAKATTKKSAAKPNHPRYIDMIVRAILELKERSGSSRQAILKHIVVNHHIDESVAHHPLNRALKAGVTSGVLKHTTGRGASGSFRLSPETAELHKPKKSRAAASTAAPEHHDHAATSSKRAAASDSTHAKSPAKKTKSN